MINSICDKLTSWYETRLADAESFETAVVSRLWSLVKASALKARSLSTNKVTRDVTVEVVVKEDSTLETFMVNVSQRVCTCKRWQETGYPCEHAVAAILAMKKNIVDGGEAFYFSDNYLRTYLMGIVSVNLKQELSLTDTEPSIVWNRQKSLYQEVDLRKDDSEKVKRSDTSTAPPSSHSPPSILRLQQSLLVLIHLHFLNHLLEHSSHYDRDDPCRALLNLKRDLSKFFKKLGYVSHHFFESSLLATKVFFQTNTFHVVPKGLPQLCSFSSFFGAELRSVFLHVHGIFDVEKFVNYSNVISGLELELKNDNDLEFLNKSSLFFPRLKQLHVFVQRCLCMAFIELLKFNVTITSIDLDSNHIGDEGARTLADALKVNTTVTIVNLASNSIGLEGARALEEALKVNTAVKNICLSYNSIGDDGTRALAQVLIDNNVVTIVNLSYNSIGDDGARALADALKVNTSVTSIDLRRNSIGDEGVRALAEALKVNSTLESLDIRRTSIGDEGVRALAEALKVNSTLESLVLENNSIGDEGARILADVLKVNSTITTVNLNYNPIGDEGARLLAETSKFFGVVKLDI
ncbi:hypothetical protein GEMRC1_009687 [Eukaryota sp. GEM-RC1]